MTEKKKYLETGKIVNTHGVRGEIKIQPWADSPEFLRSFEYFYIDGKAMKVKSSYIHKGCVICSVEGIDDVNEAMRYKNKTVFIDRDDAPLPEGGYFIQDIIGATVIEEKGGVIGTLKEVLDLPGNDVYVVKGVEREILIPAVPAFVLKVDADKGVIVVRMMEGL